MAAKESHLPCDDFSGFMELLQKQRKMDDGIIYELNTIIPTDSFSGKTNISDQCKGLHEKIEQSHCSRVNEISRCAALCTTKVRNLKEQKQNDPENYQVLKKLRTEQTNLRLFQQELNVEDIVWKRAKKAFDERCRNYYKPQ